MEIFNPCLFHTQSQHVWIPGTTPQGRSLDEDGWQGLMCLRFMLPGLHACQRFNEWWNDLMLRGGHGLRKGGSLHQTLYSSTRK